MHRRLAFKWTFSRMSLARVGDGAGVDLCLLRSLTLGNQSRLYCCQIRDYPLQGPSLTSEYLIQSGGVRCYNSCVSLFH